MTRKTKGTYTEEILRIVNTPPKEVEKLSDKAKQKYLNTMTWYHEQERIAAEAEKSARAAKMPKTAKQTIKWLNLGRKQLAKSEADRQAVAEEQAKASAAKEVKTARASAMRRESATVVVTPLSVANFMFNPFHLWSWGPSIVYGLLVQTLTEILISAGLVGADHPARRLEGARRTKLQALLGEARLNLPPLQILWSAFQSKTPPNTALVATRQYAMFASTVGLLTLTVVLTFRVLLGILFGAAHAFAQTQPIIGGSGMGGFPLTGDIATSIIDSIFGTGTGNQSLVSSGLGSMLAFYSNMILVFAGLILLWIIISAVAETARTGVPFGKQFNTVWAPIRLIVALGLLIPVASGLNSGQWIVVSLAKWGSQEATQVWTIFANNMIGSGGGASSGLTSVPLDVSNNRQFADQAFLPVLCQQVNNEVLNGSGVSCSGNPGSDDPQCVEQNTVGLITVAPTASNAGPNGVTLPTPPANQPARITWTSSTSGGQTPAVDCGSVTVQLPSGTTLVGNNQQASDLATQALLVNQSNTAASYAASAVPLADAVAKAAIAGIGGIIPLNPATGYAQYQGVFNTYMSNKTTAVAQTVSRYNGSMLTGMVQDAQKYGWIYAPVWIANVAAQNGQVMDTAQIVPSVVTPQNPFQGNQTASNAWSNAMHIVTSWEPPNQSANSPLSLQKFGMIANMMQQMTSAAGNNPLGNAGSYGSLLLTEGFELITPAGQIDCYQNPNGSGCQWAGQEVLGLPQNPNAGPLTSTQLTSYDQTMHLGAASGGATILPDVAEANSKFSLLQTLTAAGPNSNSSLRSVLFPIGMIMISVGFLLKLLTLIVLARFSLGILGWLIMVFESVLAIPFVALSFLRTDGEGFMPQQVQTNMVMEAGVVLRPTLMVISLGIGLVAFNAIMQVVNLLMAPTIQSLVSNGPTTDASYLSLGVYMIFYATLAYTLANSAFKVIDILPNFLMGWLGQRVESRVDDASMVQQQAQGYMQTMAYSARGGGGGMMSGYERQQAHQQWSQQQQANATTVQQAGFTGGMPEYERALANPSSPWHDKAEALNLSGKLYNLGPDPGNFGGAGGTTHAAASPSGGQTAANNPKPTSGGGSSSIGT